METRAPVCEAVDVEIASRAGRAVCGCIGSGCGRPGADIGPAATPIFRQLRGTIAGYTGSVYKLKQVVVGDDKLWICDCTVVTHYIQSVKHEILAELTTYVPIFRLPKVVVIAPKRLATQLAPLVAKFASELV